MTDIIRRVLELQVLTGRREGWRISAFITDVSPNGIRAQVDGELTIGTRVRLHGSSEGDFFGIVQAIEPLPGQGYTVAIRTTPALSDEDAPDDIRGR